MTIKEQLLQELEQTPENLIEATLNFLRSAKAQQPVVTDTGSSHQPTGLASLLALAERCAAELTAEELAQLPTDGAVEHDHYIYGTPKRYSPAIDA